MPSIDAPPTPKISTTSQSPPQVEFLPDPRQSRVEEEPGVDNGDIYRGEPPTPSRTPRPESLSSIAPSTSSSSSFAFGGRLGAISALVEHAITHWARAWASTSSLGSSSSSSSTSTNSITTKSRTRKRRRRRSLADLHNAKSEREVAARIRAREEARQIPREFVLHTPPSLSAGSRPSHRDGTQSGEPQANLDDILHTTELPLIISKLNMALKDNFKVRRAQGPVRVSAPRSKSVNTQQALDMSSPLLHHDYMLPEDLARRIASPEALVDPSGRKSRKSKQRASKPERSMSAPPRVPTEKEMDRAWWLDVSSPTWEDMRTIAKVRRWSFCHV